MTKGKPGIMLYFKTVEALADLDDRQFGRLVRSMLDFGRDGTEPALEGSAAAKWPFLRDLLDQDDERYRRTVERRAAAGRQRSSRENVRESAEEAERKRRMANMARYVRRTDTACQSSINNNNYQ